MSDTPTLTAQDLGWHGFTPGQSDARRIGTVASTLLLTMLCQMLLMMMPMLMLNAEC